jgi:hypothetical protein
VITDLPQSPNLAVVSDGTNALAIKALSLANDPNGSAALAHAVLTVVTNAQHGTLSIDAATGTITYTPGSGFAGNDSFRFTITDSNGATSSPISVQITQGRATSQSTAV